MLGHGPSFPSSWVFTMLLHVIHSMSGCVIDTPPRVVTNALDAQALMEAEFDRGHVYTGPNGERMAREDVAAPAQGESLVLASEEGTVMIAWSVVSVSGVRQPLV
jgi:hypothetical protein